VNVYLFVQRRGHARRDCSRLAAGEMALHLASSGGARRDFSRHGDAATLAVRLCMFVHATSRGEGYVAVLCMWRRARSQGHETTETGGGTS
jgi:hypothetical protein